MKIERDDPRYRYQMEDDEIENPEEDIVEAPEPPDFDVGDLCVTVVPIKRNWGKLPVGTAVEIKRKFIRNKVIHYDVKTLPCDRCELILHVASVAIDLLEDYENKYPSF